MADSRKLKQFVRRTSAALATGVLVASFQNCSQMDAAQMGSAISQSSTGTGSNTSGTPVIGGGTSSTPVTGGGGSSTPVPTATPLSNPASGSSSGGISAITPPTPTGRILSVGAGQQYATLSAAVAASQPGDTIQVQAGTYNNDFPNSLGGGITIEGVGGMARFTTDMLIPNRKGIFDVEGDVTLYNLDISGANVSAGDNLNGSAIFYGGYGNLVINNCYLHDNQEGIRGGAGSGAIIINNSEFYNNGNPESCNDGGCTHNIYVGQITSLIVSNSYFFAVNTGHGIKSRAYNTTIQHCVIADGSSGSGSYNINIPQGGNATITDNIIEKGPRAGNPVMISIGEEGQVNGTSTLVLERNTFINNGGSSTYGFRNNSGYPGTLKDNKFYGLATSNFVTSDGVNNQTGSTTLSSVPYATSFWTTTYPSPWPAQ